MSNKMFSVLSVIVLLASKSVQAANFTNPAQVTLGATATYGVLAATTITNSGATVINGDLGLFPGIAVTGAPFVIGDKQINNPTADLAQGALGVAYGDAASRAMDQWIAGDLGGLTLTPGVYKSATTIGITNILYLDAQFDPEACWIFQIGTAADFQVGSSIILLNPAVQNITSNHQNVFWNIGAEVRIKTAARVVGTIIAQQTIAVGLGAVTGPLFSKLAAVTLLGNVITARVLPGFDITDDATIQSAGAAETDTESQGFRAGVAIACIVIFLIVVAFIYYVTMIRGNDVDSAVTKQQLTAPEVETEKKTRYEGVDTVDVEVETFEV